MLCWNCNEPASGVCAFCGRAVCKKHTAEMPAIITIYIGDKQVPKAIVVSDALHCGNCHPQAHPIEMPELY